MKLPTKWVRIGGHKILVAYDHDKCSEHDAAGLYMGTDRIYLDPELTKQQLEEAYVHEVIEAANAILDIQLNHHSIELLGVAIHQALVHYK